MFKGEHYADASGDISVMASMINAKYIKHDALAVNLAKERIHIMEIPETIDNNILRMNHQ